MTEEPLQIKEMSYVERAIYQYIRGIFQGIDILRARKYRLYGITTFLAALIPSGALVINSLLGHQISQEMLNLVLVGEAIFALAILLTAVFGHFIARSNRLVYLGTLCMASAIYIVFYLEYLTDELLFFLARLAFYSWIVFLSVSFLGFIRSFFAEWYGAVVWAGNPEGRILFSPVVRLILLLSIGLPIYAGYKSFTDPFGGLILVPSVLSLMIALIAMLISPKRKNGNIFGTIIAFFYLYSLYHGVTSFVRGVNSPILFVDAILLMIGALYSVQTMARRAARFKNPILRKVQEERWVVIILALGLGYHVTSLHTFVVQGSASTQIANFHLGSFMACSLIMLMVLIGYYVSRRFHDWFVIMPTTGDAVKEVLKLYGPQAARMAMSALLGASREKVEDVIRGVPDAVAVGRRLFDEVRGWLGSKSQKRDEPENDV